jgi:hypothetical protein
VESILSDYIEERGRGRQETRAICMEYRERVTRGERAPIAARIF